jgi:hypothetical protein
MLADDRSTRVVHVREHHTRPAEDIILKGDRVIDRNMILDLHVSSDLYIVAHEHALAEGAALSDPGTGADMSKVPHSSTRSKHCTVIDDRT